MPDDEYKPNNSIYDGIPVSSPEVEAFKRAERFARQAKLPKFKLEEGEEFYISRDKVQELNREYFLILDELKRGFSGISFEDLESYMRSVVQASYEGEVAKLQRDGAENAVSKNVIRNIKNELLTPDYVRVRRFSRRVRPNAPMQLCIEQARIEAEIEQSAFREEIAKQKEFIFGAEPEEPYEAADELFYSLLDIFIPKHRQKRFIKKHGNVAIHLIEELIDFAAAEPQKLITDNKLFKMLIEEFLQKRNKKVYAKKYGDNIEYLTAELIKSAARSTVKTLVSEQTEGEEEPADENAAAESEEDELDELSELEEIEDELDEVEEPDEPEEVSEDFTDELKEKTSEELTEEPVQEQIELPPVAVEDNGAPQTDAEPTDAETAETVEPANESAETANADGENGNEE